MSLSRGCVFSCIFCAHKFIGKKLRLRSPNIIVEEMAMLYDKYNVRNIEFTDSTLNANNEWLKELCEKIIKLNRKIIWGCQFRADKADRKTLSLMKKSGCRELFVGVESADNQMLRRMKKGESIEKIEAGIKMMYEQGFYPELGFILGMPGETEESIFKTIKFAQKYYKSACSFTLATPYPGTEFYEMIKKKGYKDQDWSKHNQYQVVFVPDSMTKNELINYYKYAVRKVFIRSKFIFFQILKIRSFVNFLGSSPN